MPIESVETPTWSIPTSLTAWSRQRSQSARVGIPGVPFQMSGAQVVTQTTPPEAATARIWSSSMFRGLSATALGLECEAMSGWVAAAQMSMNVRRPAWVRSMVMP